MRPTVPNAQVTLVQLDNYGPWTTTPEPRREADLQTLQADLYADLSRFVGDRDGVAFYARFDNVIAVTNGMGRADHARLQETIRNRYPVTVSAATGVAAVPGDALADATAELQAAGSAQDGDRTEVLRGDYLADADRRDDDVHVAHFDVVDATGSYTDELDAYTALRHVQRGFGALSDHLHDAHGALAFFVGGDNAVAITPDLDPADYHAALDRVADAGVEMQVGVGRGRSAADAGMDAKRALETCRDRRSRIEFAEPLASGECATD
jgi:GTP cyclohydrolase IIa